MHPLLRALPLVATLALGGCALSPGGTRDDVRPPDAGAVERNDAGVGAAGGSVVPVASNGAGTSPRDMAVDPGAGLASDMRRPSGLRGAEDLLLPLPGPDGSVSNRPGAAGADAMAPLEADPVLREQVAERCASRPAGITEESLLQSLVVDLDAGGVEPALAADALIAGRCGDLADIVTEVVALGGEDAAMPVMQQAIALAGTGSELIVERAAAAGLLRAGRARVTPGPVAAPSFTATDGDYAMLYFPPGRELNAVPGGTSLTELLGNAEPGFGIYTYILGGSDAGSGQVGAGGPAAETAGLATYLELLRVVESYVLAAGSGAGRPDRGAHAFLVPVHAGREGAALVDRIGPEAAAAMRRELAAYLRRGGQPVLAARLATAPGPFLVSSLEPRLVPGSPEAVRMIVDLSGIGPEYMYSIVDVYDQAISTKAAGRVESLLAVRQRLDGVLRGRAREGGGASPAGDWIFMLGREADTRADGRAGARLAAADNRR